MDISALGYQIDSDGLVTGASNLDKLADASDRAGKASDRVGKEATDASEKVKRLGEGSRLAEAGMSSLGSAALKLGGTLAAALSFAKIANDIVTVNTEFQRLDAMMKVATGSAEAASAEMDKLRKFAAETPYSVAQSTEAFIKLKNLGLDPTIETMRSFGNTASSMGKDIMQYVEAVADATTGEFERLKEFGIKASQEGDRVALTFRGVTTEIGKNATEIQKYLVDIGNVQFAGAMGEQMATLGGQLSNLGDSVDSLYLAIGKSGAIDALASTLEAASSTVVFLTDHVDELAAIVKVAAIGLGTYATAVGIAAAANSAFVSQLAIAAATIGTVSTQVGILAAAKVTWAGVTAGVTTAVRGLLAAISPFAVGIAAATAAISYFVIEANNASAALGTLKASGDTASNGLAELQQKASAAGLNVDSLGGSAQSSHPLIVSIAMAYQGAANAAAELAKNARLAAISVAQGKITELQANRDAMAPAKPMSGGPVRAIQYALGEMGLGPSFRERADGIKEANRQIAIYQEQIKLLGKIKVFDPDPPEATAAAVGNLSAATSNAAAAATEHAKALTAEQQAMKDNQQSAVDYLENLKRQNEEFGLSEKQLRELADARIMDAKGVDEQTRAAIAFAAGVRETNIDQRQLEDQLRQNQYLKDEISLQRDLAAQRIAALQGLSGRSLAEEMAAIDVEGQKRLITLRAENEAAIEAARGNQAAADAILAKAEADKTQIDVAEKYRKQAEAVARLNEQLHNTISILQEMGGFTGGLGDVAAMLMSLKTGDFSRAPGKLGAMFDLLNQSPDGEKFLKGLGTKMDGFLGKLGTSVGGIVQGLGTFGLAVEANKMIGSIFGFKGGPLGILTGPIEKLLNPNRTANAVLTSGSGYSVGGKDKKGYESAAGLGDAVLETLNRVADALGTTVGAFNNIAIGVRGDQIRVNTNGTSLKFDKGAIGFGQDAEAAVMAAVSAAFKQGAFGGLSEGVKSYIQSGDLEARLNDVLSVKAISAEAAQRRNPQDYALGELDKQFEKLREIAKATGEGLADIEYVYGERRKEILEQVGQAAANDNAIREKEIELLAAQGQVYSAFLQKRELDLASMTDAEAAIQRQINAANDNMAVRQAEIALMDAQGDAAGVLAAQRDAELKAVSPAVAAIYERIYALQDEAAAETKRAEARKASRTYMETEQAREVELLELAGRSVDALRLKRENELRAADDAGRAFLKAKYALEDMNAAADKAAALAAQVAAEAKRIGDERAGIERQIMELTGDTVGLRREELAALDPANRALKEHYYALVDQAAAADAAAKAAEELAARNKAIADEIGGLQRQWLEVTGDVQAVRDLDLAKLQSDEARELQKQIWAYTDAQEKAATATAAAAQAANDNAKAIEDARNAVATAYQRERGELEKTADTFRGFAQSIRDFRNDLTLEANPAASVALTQAKFLNTAAMARGGDQDAFGAFAGDARAYLDAARTRASSAEDYARIVAGVMGQAGGLEAFANSRVGEEERKIAALEEQVRGIVDISDNVLSVEEAIDEFRQLTREETTPAITQSFERGFDRVVVSQEKQTMALKERQDAQDIMMTSMAASMRSIENKIANWDDGDAPRVRVVAA